MRNVLEKNNHLKNNVNKDQAACQGNCQEYCQRFKWSQKTGLSRNDRGCFCPEITKNIEKCENIAYYARQTWE
ncbi:MAG: hypothetical protein DRH26_14745 [Deltaproteobacteria bacterium]|nr:MAG: hypothetical protein DRH26_14745 [Deltaproteobacteria bacterium]